MFSKVSVEAVLCAAVAVAANGAPAFAQGNPLAGAKGLVTSVAKTRTLSQFAQNMTNESAGKFGVLLGVGLQMTASMSDMVKTGPDGKPLTVQQRKAMQASKNVAKQLTPILARYGVKSDNPMMTMMALVGSAGGAAAGPGAPKTTLPPQVTKQGRQLLTDLSVPLDKMSAASGQPSAGPMGGRTWNASSLQYKVLSPTRVALSDPKNASTPPMEARYEQGKWRVHILVDQMIQQQMQRRRAGASAGAPAAGAPR